MTLIVASNTFIQFIDVTFGDNYREFVDSDTKTEQLAMINDSSKKTTSYMDFSLWFNLQTNTGLERALCHTLMLMLRHDRNPSVASPSQQASSSPSMASSSVSLPELPDQDYPNSLSSDSEIE